MNPVQNRMVYSLPTGRGKFRSECSLPPALNAPLIMNLLAPFSLTLILSGATFVLMAALMRYRPPRKINQLYGYRTRASMASQERWDYAQQASAARSRFWGWVMVALGLMDAGLGGMPVGAGIPLSLIILIGSCVLLLKGTEDDLKKHFGPL